MLLNKSIMSTNWSPLCIRCRNLVVSKLIYNRKIEDAYTESQKFKILKVINESEMESLSDYDITKSRLRNISKWKKASGTFKNVSDIEMVDGFTDRTLKKLCDSIINDEELKKEEKKPNRIKGQYLYPLLTEDVRKNCCKVLAVYVTASSVCWSLINRINYEVTAWKYYRIDYHKESKLQITDIMNIAWQVTQNMPMADIFVMKAEATTLRAAGSDPNNPKVMAINLQKSQLVAMIVALLNARAHADRNAEFEDDALADNTLNQKVYFLRPTLPFRLFNTLVGNERVSTDQTIEMLLDEYSTVSKNNEHAYISPEIQKKFRAQNELQRDMLGNCLFLALAFMDICIYKNQNSINKLLKSGRE